MMPKVEIISHNEERDDIMSEMLFEQYYSRDWDYNSDNNLIIK